MLKYKIDSLDGLEKSLASFYEEKDGAFVLKVEGIDDGAELKRAKDHEKRARQQAEKEREELRKKLEERDQEIENLIPKSSAEEQAARLQKQLEKIQRESQQKVETYQKHLQKLLIDQKAEALARSLVVEGSEQVLVPHIKARMALDEDQMTTVFKSGDGLDYTEQELIQEFRNNPAFAPLLVASKATGGGATQSKGGGATGKTITRSQFDALGPLEKAAHVKSGGSITE